MFWYMKDLDHVTALHPRLLEVVVKDAKRSTEMAARSLIPSVNPGDNEKSPLEKLNSLVILKASKELDGKLVFGVGMIINVNKFHKDSISKGKILPTSGFMEFRLKYNALIYAPIEGEVIDAEVSAVNKKTIVFSSMGFLFGVVPIENFWYDDKYEYKEDIVIDGRDVPEVVAKFVSKTNSEKEIKIGTIVKLRIIKRGYNGTGGYWLTGSMLSPYLGPRQQQSQD